MEHRQASQLEDVPDRDTKHSPLTPQCDNGPRWPAGKSSQGQSLHAEKGTRIPPRGQPCNMGRLFAQPGRVLCSRKPREDGPPPSPCICQGLSVKPERMRPPQTTEPGVCMLAEGSPSPIQEAPPPTVLAAPRSEDSRVQEASCGLTLRKLTLDRSQCHLFMRNRELVTQSSGSQPVGATPLRFK